MLSDVLPLIPLKKAMFKNIGYNPTYLIPIESSQKKSGARTKYLAPQTCPQFI